jgi:hypothetical protein
MIVLLDVNNQSIKLYKEDGMLQIPFRRVSELSSYLTGEKVFYVTNAMEVGVNDIINLIKDMGVEVEVPQMQPLGDNAYIHNTSDGVIYINEKIKFEGKFDLKLIDEEMKQALKTFPIISQLIKNKKIEIINEYQRQMLLKEFKKAQQEQIELQKKQDEVLDKMILKTKVSDFDGTINMDEDVETIDLTNEVGGQQTMSDLMSQIEGL